LAEELDIPVIMGKPMSKHLVFVYGTLRQGGIRAISALFPQSTFISNAKVRGRLYDFGEYPGLRLDESSSFVIGEVYEVSDEILDKLDDLELESHYLRKQLTLPVGDQTKLCWVYVYDPESYSEITPIESGDWIEYAKTKTV
jgi:gamma-glutamylcyclotransferase (GGCT)/AIG2-like uncharacterized protein YtfP